MKKMIGFLSVLIIMALLVVPLAGCSNPLTKQVWEPHHGATFMDSQVVVRGKVSDSKATIWVNDIIVPVSRDGNFTTQMDLADGENIITVTAARGKPGNWKDVIARTIIVTSGLIIDVTSPADKAELTESPVIVQGKVSITSAKVTVNEIEAEVAIDGTFSTGVELIEGENIIEIVAALDGREPVTRSLTVIYTALNAEVEARNLAEEFVKNCPTFSFDGMEDTLQLIETRASDVENAWTFVFHFDSRHAGYGDRTGEMLAQVITPHEVVITVDQGQIKSAVMDGKWDMLTQQMLEEEEGEEIVEEEEAEEIAEE